MPLDKTLLLLPMWINRVSVSKSAQLANESDERSMVNEEWLSYCHTKHCATGGGKSGTNKKVRPVAQ